MAQSLYPFSLVSPLEVAQHSQPSLSYKPSVCLCVVGWKWHGDKKGYIVIDILVAGLVGCLCFNTTTPSICYVKL